MAQSQPLSDFRMADVQFELVTVRAQDRIEEPARIAGHFYYVIEGHIEGCSAGREPKVASKGETLVVTGYLGHYVQAKTDSLLLVGTEPHKHLDWLSRTLDIICVGENDSGPLLDRLRGVMELIISELSDSGVSPDQLTLERYAELTLFYFLRIANPQVEGKTIGGLVGELIDNYINANKEKLLAVQDNSEEYGLTNLSKKAFDEWDNEADAIYDDL